MTALTGRRQALDLIVTHERADFDAIASLVAAALLFPEALPVLPRQLNRNVQEFLALYRNHFRLVHADDLPRGKVKRLITVDARSVNAPRGAGAESELVVIDHNMTPSAAGGETAGAKPNPRLHELWCAPTGAIPISSM